MVLHVSLGSWDSSVLLLICWVLVWDSRGLILVCWVLVLGLVNLVFGALNPGRLTPESWSWYYWVPESWSWNSWILFLFLIPRVLVLERLNLVFVTSVLVLGLLNLFLIPWILILVWVLNSQLSVSWSTLCSDCSPPTNLLMCTSTMSFMVCRCPHRQTADLARHHLCRFTRHRPWPVQKWFSRTYMWQRRLLNGKEVE